MSEGTAVPYVRRSYLTLFQAASGLSGVRVQYSPVVNIDQALADNGWIESIYWQNATSDIMLRGMRATANVKQKEKATSELVVEVVAPTSDKTLADVEARAAALFGEVVKVIQTTPSLASPGSWLHGIACWVDGYSLFAGDLSRGGVPVWAASYTVNVHIQANVEQ